MTQKRTMRTLPFKKQMEIATVMEEMANKFPSDPHIEGDGWADIVRAIAHEVGLDTDEMSSSTVQTIAKNIGVDVRIKRSSAGNNAKRIEQVELRIAQLEQIVEGMAKTLRARDTGHIGEPLASKFTKDK